MVQLKQVHESARPLVSIIVTLFNLELYIEEALDSLQQQTYPNLEIIVVDDKSTDRSAALVEQLAACDARIMLVRQAENQGALRTKLAGIARASGDYFILCDGDDWVEPTLVETCLAHCDPRTDCVVFGFDLVEHDTRNVIRRHASPRAARAIEAGLPLSPLELSGLSHITPICFYSARNKPAFLALFDGYPALPYFEDLPSYWLTMLMADVRLIPEVLYHYRINRPGQSIDGWWQQKREVKHEALTVAVRHCLGHPVATQPCAKALLFYKLVRIAYAETWGLLKHAPQGLASFSATVRPLAAAFEWPASSRENWKLLAFCHALTRCPRPVLNVAAPLVSGALRLALSLKKALKK